MRYCHGSLYDYALQQMVTCKYTWHVDDDWKHRHYVVRPQSADDTIGDKIAALYLGHISGVQDIEVPWEEDAKEQGGSGGATFKTLTAKGWTLPNGRWEITLTGKANTDLQARLRIESILWKIQGGLVGGLLKIDDLIAGWAEHSSFSSVPQQAVDALEDLLQVYEGYSIRT